MEMDVETFETAVGRSRLARYQAELGNQYVLNAVGVKGPTVLMRGEEPVAVWTDQKDAGYPNEAIREKLVLGGGNFKDVKDERPLDVYLRERAEEIQVSGEVINKSVYPHGRWFTALPEEAVGNPSLRGSYCDFTCIFGAEVDVEALYDALEIPSADRDPAFESMRQALNMKATESRQFITPVSALRHGMHIPFGWGDDFKLADVMWVRYGLRASLDYVPNIEAIKLDAAANEPFAASQGLFETYWRPDLNPFVTDGIDDGRVFEARGE